jgi:hypothetical protein
MSDNYRNENIELRNRAVRKFQLENPLLRVLYSFELPIGATYLAMIPPTVGLDSNNQCVLIYPTEYIYYYN